MDTAEKALLVILGIALGIFLVLLIVAVAQLIKLLRTLKQVAQKAETLIESAEAVSDALRKTTGPLAAVRFARNLYAIVNHKSRK